MLELLCQDDLLDKSHFSRAADFDSEDFCDVSFGKMFVTDFVCCIERPHVNPEMSWRMFQMVKSINSLVPASIEDYDVKYFLRNPYVMGTENLWYSYYIEITDAYRNNRLFVSNLISLLEDSIYKPTNGLITEGYDIKPKFDLRLLTTNTKSRRLGYLKLMLSIFKEKSLIYEKPFLKIIGETAINYEEALLSYKNTKGIIKPTKSGGGAKPYIDVALGMNLIAKIGNGYEQGKVSRAYNALMRETENPFVMDLIDKAFFLESFLRYDYLYIYTLLEYGYINAAPSYQNLKQVYQQMLLRNLYHMKEGASNVDNIMKLNFRSVEQRIKEWKKPGVYLEHVLMPRLNWLYDLDLLTLNDNLSFCLTAAGERLFSILCEWRTCEGILVADVSPFLDSVFMKVFDNVYGGCRKEMLSEVNEDQYLKSYLCDCFHKFKSFAPNRVTFSVFANYAKWRMYRETSCAIDTDDIARGFLSRHADEYIFKFQKFYSDGYIQRKK